MVTVPLTLLDLHGDGFHLLMEVVVLGQKYQAVLDTGASKTVFDQDLLQQLLTKSNSEKTENNPDTLSLRDSDKLSTGLGTNSMKSFSFVVPELTIGNLVIKGQEIAVLDLSTINNAYGELEIEPVIGVIGGDILHAYSAVIRYSSPGNSGPTLKLRKTKIKRP